MKKWIISAILYLLVVIAVYTVWASFNKEPLDEHQNHQSISPSLPIEQKDNGRV
ncbi:hypothetical protein [Priestia megaterium]|uniref:hypothetical protein n=1 Tax=Priestia megaterium TaxID=1404 RepID=UPI0030091A8E